MKRKKLSNSFTLIEILIVIVMIGVLASFLIPRITFSIDKAKKTSAQYELGFLSQLLFLAHQNTNLTIKDITNNSCTYCSNATHDMANKILYIWKNENSWKAALQKISTAAGESISLQQYYIDPRWYPYLLDENEGENYNNDNCRTDTLLSVWKDWATTFSWTLYRYQSNHSLDKDNTVIDLRPRFCAWGY